MSLPFVFANQTQPNLSWLDADFNAVGALTTLPCLLAGTNTITLTQSANTPTITAYENYMRFSGIVAVDNTGAVTAQVGALSALPVYKDTVAGPVALTGTELQAGNYAVFTYDSALNSGGGGFHVSAPSSGGGSGTVTSVGSGTGLTGGPITGTGTLSLATITNLRLLANVSGGTAVPSANTLTGILDQIIGATVAAPLIRGASAWQAGQVISAVTTAAGSNQGTAAAIGFCNLAVLASVGSGTGIILPATTYNYKISVVCRGGNNLLVYPPSGGQIEALGTNAADTVVATTGNACYEVSANNQIYRTVAS